MMSEIHTFTGKGKPYQQEAELFRRVLDLVHEYDGMVSIASVLGVLELVKDQIKEDAQQ
jgi:hypothetical protein